MSQVSWLEAVSGRSIRSPWGIYLHVPYCASRCGYCDFNTYTAAELGPGVSQSSYAHALIGELRLARSALPDAPPVDTIFIGGGTPTLLGAAALVRILETVGSEFGLAASAEITTEANPDSIDRQGLEVLRNAGFTRISFGVQSLAPQVLDTLERTHTPGRSLAALREARQAGFEHISADLIYGTPGESDDDLALSVDGVLETGIDHLSAYALIVEPGTRLARQVGRGDIPLPDDDIAADRYEMVDRLATRAGMQWYEVSNWARPEGECRHNLGYWRGADWWGAGPGAHGHLGSLRWWNLKHPAAYTARIDAGELPVDGWEALTADDARLEDAMLRIRVRDGLPCGQLTVDSMAGLVDDGLVRITTQGNAVLTDRGRLLADLVVRRLAFR
ncbi:MAG: coproporphyrinogen III oxidase [Actinobacteria bacterium]|nr:coproporphyrinogen III oxidase [Actinomycetota bacterium]